MTMRLTFSSSIFFFFNDTATPEIYTLSLHDALPISDPEHLAGLSRPERRGAVAGRVRRGAEDLRQRAEPLHVHGLFELGPRDARVCRSAGARHRRRPHLSQSPDDQLWTRSASVTLTGAQL